MVAGEFSTQQDPVESDLTKQLKQDESEIGEDRISTLPDSVIADLILSRFLNTKFIISIEVLVDFGFRDKAFLEFYNAVNITLGQYQLESITKFEVDANYDTRFASHVKNWIEFAVSRYVKDFTLYLRHLGDDDTYSIENESFYKSSHFTSIDIGYCLLQPNVGITWNNLKNLTISKSRLEQDLIPKIVSASPLLDTLTLCECHGCLIEITSPSVKNLEILGYESDDLESFVEINAPYITYLKIVDSLWISSISLKNVSYLVKAYLNFDFPRFYPKIKKRDEELVLGEVIIHLQHVNEVEVGISCYLAICRLTAKGFKLLPNVVGVDTSSMYYADYDVAVEGSDSD